jgi:tetratricopeptide (TPR) repeat protein
VPARINLGRALLVLGRPQEAVTELEKALQVATDDEQRGRALLELGHAREALGRPEDWEAAIGHYKAVLQLYPDDPMRLGPQIARLEAALAQARGPAPAADAPANAPAPDAPASDAPPPADPAAPGPAPR